jgi:hypothetical protein
MIVMPITILFIDFAAGLCQNPRQQGLVGMWHSAELVSPEAPALSKMELSQRPPRSVAGIRLPLTQMEPV